MFRELLVNFLIVIIRLWQKSRKLRSAFNFSQCRFYPSCSDYSLDALKIYRFLGLVLAIKRVFKCHPLSRGGIDCVPMNLGNNHGS